MNNIDKILEQIENLTIKDFQNLKKKYLTNINLKQKQEFHLRFPNLELDECSKIDCIGQSFYYYKFSSQNHSYEFEINKSNKNKYSFKFYVNGELEWSTQKITGKKILVAGQLDIITHFDGIGDDINQIDITVYDLNEVVNWLFGNKKFLYDI